MSGDAREQMQTYGALILGTDDGYVAARYGRERYYAWPSQQEQVWSDAERFAVNGDAYICPAIRFTGDRHKWSAKPPRMLWTDLDGEIADLDLYVDIGGYVVASGTPGRQHLYSPLSRPVDLATHEQLNKALATRLGGEKYTNESLLRLPG